VKSNAKTAGLQARPKFVSATTSGQSWADPAWRASYKARSPQSALDVKPCLLTWPWCEQPPIGGAGQHRCCAALVAYTSSQDFCLGDESPMATLHIHEVCLPQIVGQVAAC